MAQLKIGTTIGGNTAYHQGNLDPEALKGMSANEKVNQNILFQNVAKLDFQDSLEAIAYKGGSFDVFSDETKIATKTQVTVDTLAVGADNGSVVLTIETAGGGLDTGYTLNANNTVEAIYQTADGKIYVGGHFTTIGGQSKGYLARLNSDGTLDTGYTLNANSSVRTIHQAADGKIYVGGSFGIIGGQFKSYFARLNSDGTLDTAYTMNGMNSGRTVEAIYQAADGKIYVGGSFDTLGGQNKTRLARLNSDGTLDTGYTLNANSSVLTIYQTTDEKIYVGGNFTTIGPGTQDCLARLNSDGTLDTAYTMDADSGVWAIHQAADGKIYVGGVFATIGGQSRTCFARLNSDGTLDTAYTMNTMNAMNRVWTIHQAADERIYVGGTFTTIGGSSKDRLARMAIDANFTTGNFISTSLDLTGDLAAAPTKVVVSSTFATPTDTTLSLKISDGTPANDVTITSANFDTEVDCSSLTTRTLTLQWLFTSTDTAATPTLNNYGVYFT